MKLPEILHKKYQSLIDNINYNLPLEVYTELICFSRNIREGVYDDSFYISEINQNSSSLNDLLSECSKSEIDGLIKEIDPNKYVKKHKFQKNGSFPVEKIDSFPPKNATTNEILKNAAFRLGLEYISYGGGLSSIVECETGRKRMFIHSMSQYTLNESRIISNNKMLTKKILEKNSINTPAGICLKIHEKDKGIKYIKNFFGESKKWVLKPLQGSGGIGVTGGIESTNDLSIAWDICEKLNCTSVILEEEVKGNDYRIVVIQDYIFSVTHRGAAYVVGDGISSIEELIGYKSRSRKQNPYYALKPFKANQIMINFLEKKGYTLKTIPSINEKVQLLDAVNIGSGGESIDKTSNVHPDWGSIAVEARKAISDAFHVGIDLMAEDISLSPREQKWAIIEINVNPDLGLVLYPGEGKSYDIGVELIKSNFGGLVQKNKKYYELKIFGVVQKVGFRKYFQKLCQSSGVRGKIWNDSNKNNLVTAKLYGYETIVNSVINTCLSHEGRFIVKDIVMNQLREIEVIDDDFVISQSR